MKKVTIKKILNIINKSIETGDIAKKQMNDNLSDLGIDSMKFIQIMVELEEVFECEIPDSQLLMSEMNTVQKIYDSLQNIYINLR